MSDMKCPVCNVGYVHESVNHWCCDYEFCPSYDETDTETYDILIRTRKALEQSKICCTEWEKQALDYKAENIALSGDLERTRKALEFAWDALIYDGTPASKKALDKIKALTALEQKDK